MSDQGPQCYKHWGLILCAARARRYIDRAYEERYRDVRYALSPGV